VDLYELLVSAGIIGAVTAFATWVTRETKPLDYVDRSSPWLDRLEGRK
jgi:hypothetical protein